MLTCFSRESRHELSAGLRQVVIMRTDISRGPAWNAPNSPLGPAPMKVTSAMEAEAWLVMIG